MMQLVEIQYFPCVDYFKSLINGQCLLLENFENFQKASFRNRCMIAGSHGSISLSIPLVNGRLQQSPIRKVEIDYSIPWNQQHWKTIISCYKRSPYFDYYAPEIESLLFCREANLFVFNQRILEWVLQKLKIPNSISYTHSYISNYSTADIMDARHKWLPKTYQEVSGSWAPEYTQVFGDKTGFLKNLSILDLLFCEGPNAAKLLKASF